MYSVQSSSSIARNLTAGGLRPKFDQLSYSARKEFARGVDEAKAEDRTHAIVAVCDSRQRHLAVEAERCTHGIDDGLLLVVDDEVFLVVDRL